MRLHGKTAIVTGASRGIGLAIASRLYKDGANLVLSFIRDGQFVDIAQTMGGSPDRAVAVEADIRSSAQVKTLFDEAECKFGSIDIVVANAGINMSKTVAETTDEDFQHIFSVNAQGTFFVFREAARRVKNGGRIIGITSNMTLQSRAGVALYSASKAAVEQFVKILARELGPKLITVNAVAPGPTDTNMVSQLSRDTAPGITPLGRLGRPEDIADVVAFVASADARWITGQIVGANGGII
jgi:3-oxoacyl-[acyl-carrier protein] reductase